MECLLKLDINIQLNHGELVELWQESQESVEVVLPDLDRVPSVTCAEKVECLHH